MLCCVRVCTCLYVSVCTCACVRMCACARSHMYACTRARVCFRRVCVYVGVCVRVCKQTHLQASDCAGEKGVQCNGKMRPSASHVATVFSLRANTASLLSVPLPICDFFGFLHAYRHRHRHRRRHRHRHIDTQTHTHEQTQTQTQT